MFFQSIVLLKVDMFGMKVALLKALANIPGFAAALDPDETA